SGFSSRPATAAGHPVLFAARHAGGRQGPARPRLHHRRVLQEPSRRPHRVVANCTRLPGILQIHVAGASGRLAIGRPSWASILTAWSSGAEVMSWPHGGTTPFRGESPSTTSVGTAGTVGQSAVGV